MSTQTAPALGSRENFHWETTTPIEELCERPIEDLNVPELRRVIEHETSFNLAVDTMPKPELRAFLRDLRSDSTKATVCVTTYERAQWKAHQEFRKRADKVSKVAKYHPPNLPGGRVQQGIAWIFDNEHLDHDPMAMHTERCEVELTEPTLHMAKEHEHSSGFDEYCQFRHRRRYDPEHGYIGGVAFPELKLADFRDIVSDVLLDLQSRHSFAQKKVDKWLDAAIQLKQTPNHSDQEALAQVLMRIFFATNDN